MSPILVLDDVSVKLPAGGDRSHAMEKVSLTLAANEILCVVGESGSGKSMTANAIMRLLPGGVTIDGGQILFEGRDLCGLGEAQMRKVRGAGIAMIFQEPMTALNPLRSIGDQIGEMFELHTELSAAEIKARTLALLEEVRIPDPALAFKAYPHELSGGQRQRAMIAMALALDPKVLIADEPTTALDVTIQAQILDLMRELQETFGTAIILITHDMGVVAENADRVVVMYAGRKVEETSADRLFDNPGHPYTRGLLASIPHLDTAAQSDARRARLNEIKGMVPSLFNLPQGCSFAPRCGLASDRCREVRPPLEEQRPGHWIACWHADKALAGMLVGAGA